MGEAHEKRDRDRNVDRHTTHMTCNFRETEEFKVSEDGHTALDHRAGKEIYLEPPSPSHMSELVVPAAPE